METDLEGANEALAGGRADEASVYAWNALADIGPDDAPELARIARELDDPRLLREIERRGFSTLPAQAPEPEPVKRKSVLRLLRALPALAFVLIVAAAIVASIPTESGARHPAAKDTTSEARFARPILAESSGIWLVPVGEARSVNVARLADELALRYPIPVGTLPNIALPSWTIFIPRSSRAGNGRPLPPEAANPRKEDGRPVRRASSSHRMKKARICSAFARGLRHAAPVPRWRSLAVPDSTGQAP